MSRITKPALFKGAVIDTSFIVEAIEGQKVKQSVPNVFSYEFTGIARKVIEVDGAGTLGTVDVPIDRIEKSELTLEVGNIEKDNVMLLKDKTLDVVFSAVEKNVDNTYVTRNNGQRIRTTIKNIDYVPNSITPGEKATAKMRFAVYAATFSDGHERPLLKFDLFNTVYEIDGENQREDIDNFLYNV